MTTISVKEMNKDTTLGEFTGYKDTLHKPICVGDVVKFRIRGYALSGRGTVFKDKDDPKHPYKLMGDPSIGRIYYFYDDARYSILRKWDENTQGVSL